MLTLMGNVLSCRCENRDLVGKDGVKHATKISHVVLLVSTKEGPLVCNCKTYDENFVLPENGKSFTTPAIKKYENYSGVADVSF